MKVLSDRPSKLEEVEFLKSVADYVGKRDTHLKDLFSPALVAWVEHDIQNDFSPDLYENFSCANEDTRNEAKELKQRLNDYQIESNNVINLKKAEIDNLTEKFQRSADRVQRLEKEINEQYDNLMDWRGQYRHAEKQVLFLRERLNELKIMVFDMQHTERQEIAD